MHGLARIPLTVLFATLMLVTAWAQGTFQQDLSPEDHVRYGLSLADIARGDIAPFVTSIFVVSNAAMLVRHVLHLLYAVGSCEALVGTRRTFVLFWVFQVVITLLYGLAAWGLARIANPGFLGDLATDNFGPSSAGSACFGYAISCVDRRWERGCLVLAFAVGYVVKVMWILEPSNDLTHLIGFPVGWALGTWLKRRSLKARRRELASAHGE